MLLAAARAGGALRRVAGVARLGTAAPAGAAAAAASAAAGAPAGGAAARGSTPRVLVTGAGGQIGLELVPFLRKRYGSPDAVLATDVNHVGAAAGPGPFAYLDVTDGPALERLVVEHRIDTVIHLASLLSAVGERNPRLAQRVNVRGIENVLETAAARKLRVFAPSTIAVFGPSTPRHGTPDPTVMRPTTIYGTTKVYLELLGEYYAAKFGVDFRSLRYPGVISNAALPGGGTTDYAVDIFYKALEANAYTCFLKADTALPMMYMPDCIRATVELLEAPAAALTQRVYNLTAVSFTPAELGAAIRAHQPGFKLDYAPDFRQAIADSWPASIDDAPARRDWGWKHAFGTAEITADMLAALSARLKLPIRR